jgi:hypothetical protein
MVKKAIILTLSTFVLITAGIAIYKNYFKKIEIPDGGPCSYEEEYFPARILAMDYFNSDSSEMNLTFEIDYQGMLDTVQFAETNESYYQADTGILQPKIGQVVQYVHKYIVSGSCSPDFFYIEMLPYTKVR